MRTSRVSDAALGVFHPGWMLAGIGVGLGIQLVAGLLNLGLLGGLPSYFVMGVVIGLASSGRTIIEPGIAAFLLAAIGYVFGHVVLSLFGVGFLLAAVYGAVGMVLAVAGGWLGESL